MVGVQGQRDYDPMSETQIAKRPPEPHSRGQGRSQPPNVTNASLLETYRFLSSHSLRKSQPKINDLPTFSRLFRAQACPEKYYRDIFNHILRRAR
jgi:hypothetical protein